MDEGDIHIFFMMCSKSGKYFWPNNSNELSWEPISAIEVIGKPVLDDFSSSNRLFYNFL